MRNYIRLFIPPIFFQLKWIFLKRINSNKIKPDPHLIESYSQYGEDLVLDGIFRGKMKGFYIDIGAHDPEFQSNTLRFYMRGWQGINIEPIVSKYNKFQVVRERDININCGVHNEHAELTFYHSEWETLSTFNKERALKNAKNFNKEIIGEYKIPVKRLSEILGANMRDDQHIDFLSIDTEGNELNILKGNDWKKYRPQVILIETADQEIDIHEYLVVNNYSLVFKNHLNSIYLDKQKA